MQFFKQVLLQEWVSLGPGRCSAYFKMALLNRQGRSQNQLRMTLLPRSLLTKCVLQANVPALYSHSKPHHPALATQYLCQRVCPEPDLNEHKLNLYKRINETGTRWTHSLLVISSSRARKVHVFQVEVQMRVSALPIPTLHSLSKLASLMASQQVGKVTLPSSDCHQPHGQSSHFGILLEPTSQLFRNSLQPFHSQVYFTNVSWDYLWVYLWETTKRSPADSQGQPSQSCPTSLWAPQSRDWISLCVEHSASPVSGDPQIFLEETQSGEKDCRLQEVSQAWNQNPEVPPTIS